MKMQAYLAFDGNCQEALNYYADIFDASITNRQTYENEKDMDIPDHFRSKLQHAELKGKGVEFMAYDASPDTPLTHGNQIHMSIAADSIDEATRLFNSLSDHGRIHHPLKERSWGHFGRCSDKYGINWMVNCNSK